jgi:hypothetical protein
MATTSLVFAAGIYPEMLDDFRSVVDGLTSAALQLALGPGAGTQTPLLAAHRDLLRLPISSRSVCGAR